MLQRVVAGTVAAVAAALTLVGCANPDGGAALVGAPAASDTPTAAYQRLVETIYGTRTDRLLGEKLAHHRQQTAIRDCMQKAGFEYRAPGYVGLGGTWDMAIGDFDGAAPLGPDFGIAPARLQVETARRANAATGGNPAGLPTAPNADAYNSAMDGCATAGGEWAQTAFPDGAHELAGELENAMFALAEDPQYKSVHAGYVACMKAKGYKLSAWADVYEQLSAQLYNLPADDVAAGNPKFEAAAAAERRTAADDNTCRAALVDWTMTALRPTVDRTYQQQQTTLTDISDGWETIRRDAATAGIKP